MAVSTAVSTSGAGLLRAALPLACWLLPGSLWLAAGDVRAAPEPIFDGGVTDTIVVSATRPLTLSFPVAPAVVTVVPLEEGTGGADLAELLEQVAGLQIRRYGGLGAQALPSIRGSTAAQVAILVDGVPLADAQDGAVDLADLPQERFARAEIYRGLVPAATGGPGGAGAINLVTREAAAGSSLRLFTGSFGDLGGRISHDALLAGGRLRHQLTLHGRRSDLRYPFLDHNQTLHDESDDRERTRRNAQFAEYGGFLTEDWDPAGLRLQARAGYLRRDGGRPGPLGHESPHAAVRRQRGDGHLSLQTASGLVRLDLMASSCEERLHDDLQEVGWDPAGTVRSLSSEIYARGVLAPRLALPWSGRDGREAELQLRAGLDGRRQWYRESLNGETDPLRARTSVTAFAEADLELPATRLVLTPGWRWTRAEDNFPALVPPWMPWLEEEPLAEPHVVQAVTPSLGAVWEAVPGRLQAVAHAARNVRLPTWVELFGHRGGIDGNRELRPETIKSWDAGLQWRDPLEGTRLRLVYFQVRTADAILFIQNSQRTSQAWNFGAVRTSGVELEGARRLPGRLRSTLNLTWQRARDDGPDPAYHGKELPFLPSLEGRLALDAYWGAWQPGLALTFEGHNFRDRYNAVEERAPPRTLLNLKLARNWSLPGRGGGRLLTLTAELINTTDNAVYDVEGYPLPGRSYRFSCYLR